MTRAEVILVTGGLGPPTDALTREIPADLLGLTGPRVRTVTAADASLFGDLLGDAHSWWAIPATERGEQFGVLLVGAGRNDVMTEAQAQMAAAVAGQGMTAYENARLFSQVRQMATVDGLTGLFNRNHFFTEADWQLRVARRHQQPRAAIMLDIDHFKRINDTYGHPVGDEVIQVVASRLRGTAGGDDVLGRYGGEEFALVTPHTGRAAEDLAERRRRVVSATPIPTAAGPLPVTISVGLACLDGGDEDLGHLLGRADNALYQAKQTGRDRVCVDFAG